MVAPDKVGAMLLGIPLRAIRAALFGIIITFVALPIAALPYMADDTMNRNWPTYPLSEQISSAWKLNDTWMYEQGRFFPGGSIYALTMWNLLSSRAAYMTYLVLLNILLVVLVALIIWRITRSAHMAAFAGFATAMCLQLRFGYLDGIASFGGLVLYTLILTLIAGLLAAHVLRGGSHWWAVVVVVVWGLAITAYEVSLLMLPAVLLVLWATGPSVRGEWRRWLWGALPLVVPAVLALGTSFYLRRHPLPLAPAYQTNLDGPVWTTLGKQFTAALPFTQEGILGAPFENRLAVMLLIVLAVPAFLAWRPWAIRGFAISPRVSAALIGAGLWAWVVPSVLAAVTARWQTELVWGQGYIYLAYEFVGLALVLTGIAGVVRSYAPAPWARVAFSVLFGIVLVACVLTAAENILNVGTLVPGPAGPG
ncbi:MAG: hypothetical protein WCI83_07565 [Thermoleophilia bacterium]